MEITSKSYLLLFLKSIVFQKNIIEKEIENLKNIKSNLFKLGKTLSHAMSSLSKPPQMEELEFLILLINYKK